MEGLLFRRHLTAVWGEVSAHASHYKRDLWQLQ